MNPLHERARLNGEDRGEELPAGYLPVKWQASGPGDPGEILLKSRTLLSLVLEGASEPWPEVHEWALRFPAWFLRQCAPERSRADEESWLREWRSLPEPERARMAAEKPWSLSGWIYWFRPENRTWFWWRAQVMDARSLQVHLAAPGWPYPSGAFRWMMRASGADRIEEGHGQNP